jgi:hypothetical protein
MNIPRSLISVTMASLFMTASFGDAFAAVPFKTLRAATNPNGTLFVGGGGLTVTHVSTGHYHVAFPLGTWNNGSSSCFFVPQVQAVFTTAVAEITGWTTFGDGSGVVDIAVSSGADAPLMMVFTSANC